MPEVEEQLHIAPTGRELETTLMNMDSAAILPLPVLETMRLNAEQVGDEPVTEQLARRIASIHAEQDAGPSGERGTERDE